MKYYVLTFSLILFGLVLHAQTYIQGKVTNSNGEPLIGASVFLPEHNKGTICNIEGTYKIENFPTGKGDWKFQRNILRLGSRL